jgi:hypothetical protein
MENIHNLIDWLRTHQAQGFNYITSLVIPANTYQLCVASPLPSRYDLAADEGMQSVLSPKDHILILPMGSHTELSRLSEEVLPPVRVNRDN